MGTRPRTQGAMFFLTLRARPNNVSSVTPDSLNARVVLAFIDSIN